MAIAHVTPPTSKFELVAGTTGWPRHPWIPSIPAIAPCVGCEGGRLDGRRARAGSRVRRIGRPASARPSGQSAVVIHQGDEAFAAADDTDASGRARGRRTTEALSLLPVVRSEPAL